MGCASPSGLLEMIGWSADVGKNAALGTISAAPDPRPAWPHWSESDRRGGVEVAPGRTRNVAIQLVRSDCTETQKAVVSARRACAEGELQASELARGRRHSPGLLFSGWYPLGGGGQGGGGHWIAGPTSGSHHGIQIGSQRLYM
jgi:hypothetical protein